MAGGLLLPVYGVRAKAAAAPAGAERVLARPVRPHLVRPASRGLEKEEVETPGGQDH
ncbi:hypothetical protein GCM10010191_26570 [Actinomadura vinacea]|uniref:Uncharacterized protein n=1 Tax=Actinomadura vinacea TaxID=115336 RepID=A0ABP5W0R3_9ACTN